MSQAGTRRNFLAVVGRAAAGLALGGAAAGSTPRALQALTGGETTSQRDLPFKISLAQWSLHRTIRSGRLDPLDFARYTRETFDIDAIEYVNTFFKDKATDAKYLAELNRRAADHGIYQHLIMCDGEGRLGDPDEQARLRAVENHYRWVDAAKTLGCAMIRVNAYSEGSREEQARLVADGLRRLCEYADPVGIDVVVENHGGFSSDASWLVDVMRRVDHPRCGTLPDFGNFHIGDGVWYDIYQGVAELMPYAKAVSAKSHDFDENGEETQKDYGRLIRIVLDAGYRGWIGIEYEGSRLSEEEGVRRTKALLERVGRSA